MATLNELNRSRCRVVLVGAIVVVASGYPTYVAHPITLLAPVPLLVALLLLNDARLTAPLWLVSVVALVIWTGLLYLAMDGTARGLIYSVAMYAPFGALAYRIRRPEPVALVLAVIATSLLIVRVLASWVRAGASWRPWQVYEGNTLAPRLTILLPLVLIVLLAVPAERWWHRGAVALLFLAGVVSIVVTQQRAALGVVAVLTILGLARTSWKALIAVGAGGVLAWLVSSQSIVDVLERLRFVNFKNSSATRPEIWDVAIDALRASSWLGVGPGNSDDALRAVGGGHAHNGLVQAALEVGSPGALLFAALVIYLIVLAVRLLRQGGKETLWALSLLAYLGFSVVSAPIQRPDFTLVLVLVVMTAREHLHPRVEPCAA